jgi:hypothetical protein
MGVTRTSESHETALHRADDLKSVGPLEIVAHRIIVAARDSAGEVHPDRSFVPKLVAAIGPDQQPEQFKQFVGELRNSLGVIERTARQSNDNQINILINAIKKVPITVYYTNVVHGNVTDNTAVHEPATIYWNPTDTVPYKDGASNIPAAALLHELTHAARFYYGYEVRQGFDEIVAVWAENWLIWREGGTQRTIYYDGDTPYPLPPDQVLWPQAADLSWKRTAPPLQPSPSPVQKFPLGTYTGWYNETVGIHDNDNGTVTDVNSVGTITVSITSFDYIDDQVTSGTVDITNFAGQTISAQIGGVVVEYDGAYDLTLGTEDNPPNLSVSLAGSFDGTTMVVTTFAAEIDQGFYSDYNSNPNSDFSLPLA